MERASAQHPPCVVKTEKAVCSRELLVSWGAACLPVLPKPAVPRSARLPPTKGHRKAAGRIPFPEGPPPWPTLAPRTADAHQPHDLEEEAAGGGAIQLHAHTQDPRPYGDVIAVCWARGVKGAWRMKLAGRRRGGGTRDAADPYNPRSLTDPQPSRKPKAVAGTPRPRLPPSDSLEPLPPGRSSLLLRTL